jgi:hypothetical protein
MAVTRHLWRMTPGWTLAATELRIPWGSGVAAHRMITVGDPAGKAVRQLNGLASWFDPAAGVWRHKPIGYLPSDRLRGYDTRRHPRTFMPIHGCPPGGRDLAAAIGDGCATVLADRLSAADVEAVLAPGLSALARINALSDGPEGGAGLPYPFMGFGRNSNSFFSTVLHAMGFDEPRFARPAAFNPGQRQLLLSANDLTDLRCQMRRQLG